MTTYIIDDTDIITDFLRTHLTDPQARAEASRTENITATAGQTTITLSPTVGTVSAITAVTVEGATKNKWADYFWDYQNQKITFYTALTLDDAVVITYKQGTSNWIYADKPDDKLSEDSWPRIEIYTLSGGSKRLGNYQADIQSQPTVNISVWAKDRQVFTINGNKYSNNYLSRYIAYRIMDAFEDNEGDMDPVLYDFEIVGTPRAAPYSPEYQCYHTVMEVNYKGIKMGRIEV